MSLVVVCDCVLMLRNKSSTYKVASLGADEVEFGGTKNFLVGFEVDIFLWSVDRRRALPTFSFCRFGKIIELFSPVDTDIVVNQLVEGRHKHVVAQDTPHWSKVSQSRRSPESPVELLGAVCQSLHGAV